MKLRPALPLAVGAVALIMHLAGCGQQEQETVTRGADLNRQIIELEQGALVDDVKSQLGEPRAETNKGSVDGLSYGIWQLAFVDGRLTTRSKVINLGGGSSAEGGRALDKMILRLQLGTKLKVAETRLGTPEVMYVIYEGESQPIKILRYGPWELTFVKGQLSQRAQ
jgi:hypothetical protein